MPPCSPAAAFLADRRHRRRPPRHRQPVPVVLYFTGPADLEPISYQASVGPGPYPALRLLLAGPRALGLLRAGTALPSSPGALRVTAHGADLTVTLTRPRGLSGLAVRQLACTAAAAARSQATAPAAVTVTVVTAAGRRTPSGDCPALEQRPAP